MTSLEHPCRRCKQPIVFTGAALRRRNWVCVPCKAAEYQDWRARNPSIRDRERERHAERYKTPEERFKRRARRLVQKAIAAGTLTPSPCELCGITAEAHHDDYEKPLVVRWLCPSHHRQHHSAAGRSAS